MKSIRKQASLVTALAVLAACGSSSGGSSSTTPQQPRADTCTEGAACAPANPCHQGKTSCASSSCVDTGVALADGSACGAGFVCASGACAAACIPSQLCDAGDACRIGATTCTAPWSAPTCSPAGNKPDGTACGTGQVCSAGACVTPSTIARVWVDDATAPLNGTATLRADVTLGSGSPSHEVDWWTEGCPGAWVEPTRGVSTTFHAPPCPGCDWRGRTKCRVRAVSVADPTKSDTAYVIVGGGERKIVTVGPAPWGVAVDRQAAGGHQLVLAVASTGSGNVQLFDMSGRQYSNQPVGTNPRGDMAVDESWTPSDRSFHVWITITGENKVARVGFGSPAEEFDVGTLPHGVAMAGSEVWVANYGSSTLTKLDRSTGATLGTFPIGAWGRAPTGIAYDGSTLWVSTATGVLNLTTAGELIRSITPVADPYGIVYAASTGYVWFANHGSNTVVRVTPTTGEAATFTVGNAPIGIAPTGDGTIWVTNSGDDTVSEIRQSDGATVATLKTGPMPFGVAYSDMWGGWQLWVTSYGGDDVRRLF